MVLQANPKQYDIDAALGALDRIWWRVPQYTNEIRTGDVAVLWRSGKKAGIIGLGRVIPILSSTRWTRQRSLSAY